MYKNFYVRATTYKRKQTSIKLIVDENFELLL